MATQLARKIDFSSLDRVSRHRNARREVPPPAVMNGARASRPAAMSVCATGARARRGRHSAEGEAPPSLVAPPSPLLVDDDDDDDASG